MLVVVVSLGRDDDEGGGAGAGPPAPLQLLQLQLRDVDIIISNSGGSRRGVPGADIAAGSAAVVVVEVVAVPPVSDLPRGAWCCCAGSGSRPPAGERCMPGAAVWACSAIG